MLSTDSNIRTSRARRVTWIGIAWNIALTSIKLVAGIFGKSQALIADAIHSISDFISDFAVLAGLKIADKPVDHTHNYGHGKFETLSSIIINILLFSVAIGITWEGITTIYDIVQGKTFQKPEWFTFVAAFLSVVIKEGLFRYTLKEGKSLNSPALITNSWHHRSDALSSLAVMLGIGGSILFGNKWVVLDPIAALIVAVLIFRFAYTSFFEAMNELLEASLGEEYNAEIKRIAATVPGANNPHNLRSRKIGKNVAIDMHIKVDPNLSITEAHDIATHVEDGLKEKFGPDSFISIHVEPEVLKPDQPSSN